MNFRRGDIVTCAPPGDFGKSRPAFVLQADLLNATHTSVTLCPVTSHRLDAPLFRVSLKADTTNGLKADSQAMADKLTTLRSDRIGAVIGRLNESDLERIDAAVMLWLGLKT
jgi:mRNA interferase MazF